MDHLKWIEKNKVVVLVGLLLVVFLALGFFSRPAVIEERESAIDFVLKEAAGAYPNASMREINAVREGDRWKVDVKISLNAHSPCPTVIVRKYELLPIFFREEQIIKNCMVSGTIVFEEEAVAASARTGLAKTAAESGALWYATYFSKDVIDAVKNCPECVTTFPPVLVESIQNTSSQNIWVVEWRMSNESVFAVLSEKGELLAERKS